MHFHDHLAPCHLDLLIFHALPALLHLVNFLLVANFLSLSFLPFLECYSSHDLHALFGLFLFLINTALLMVLDLLLVRFPLLLHQALLQPVLERFVAFLLLDLLLQPLRFLLPEQLLLLERLADQLLLLPFVHAMRPLLVVLVERRLLHDHLFEQILFGLPDEDLAKALLVLLDAQPLVVGDLRFGEFVFALAVHLEHTFVDLAHFRFVNDALLKVHLLVMLRTTIFSPSIGIIDVSLSRFIQPLEQSFIVQVLAVLLVHVGLLVSQRILIRLP